MRKISLLLVLAALAFSSKAINFPAEWDIASTNWSGYETAPAGFTRQTAEAVYYGEYLDLSSIDFFEEWDRIPEGYEYPMTKRVLMPEGINTKANDGQGSFKVGYDDEGIIVYCYYIDDEVTTKGEKWEVAYSPYRKLGEGGRNFTTAFPEDRSGVLYTRYWELGASKLTIMSGGVDGIMQLYGGSKLAQDASKSLVSKFEVEFYSFSDNFSPNEIRWVIKIPYYALDDTYYNTQFTKNSWPEACDGNGLSFDVKFREYDSDLQSGQYRDYWWNSNTNSGFWSADFAGYLKQGPPIDEIGIDDAVLQSNITITPAQIELAEVADVQIFTASGLLVKSVANVTVIPTNDLLPGAYIVVAGNEVAKFVK